MALEGEVTDDGVVQLWMEFAGRHWPAAIDTGFNGDLELPEALFATFGHVFVGIATFELAAGQQAEEDLFYVEFPFDGESVAASTTFVLGDTILIGTGLLRHHRLTVDFVARTVLIERVAPAVVD
jgi:predicted aspartyl protease